jgi:hypothetical protein
MRKLVAFNHVSLDGYFVTNGSELGEGGTKDAEWNEFVRDATARPTIVRGHLRALASLANGS